MKIKDGFILREIAGSFVVVPVGQNMIDFSSMITTNETGAFLWNELSKGSDEDSLSRALLAEYTGIDEATAKADIAEFLKALEDNNILE